MDVQGFCLFTSSYDIVDFTFDNFIVVFPTDTFQFETGSMITGDNFVVNKPPWKGKQ